MNTEFKDKEIYQETADTWGIESQVDKTIEECSELIQALIKLKFDNSVDNYNHVCEEIGDVENMLNQLKMFFNPYIVERYRLQKLENVKEIVRKKKKEK